MIEKGRIPDEHGLGNIVLFQENETIIAENQSVFSLICDLSAGSGELFFRRKHQVLTSVNREEDGRENVDDHHGVDGQSIIRVQLTATKMQNASKPAITAPGTPNGLVNGRLISGIFFLRIT